ncbi:MGDG synthase family glycosyltransferase [Clostridium paraputrificum]|uniref:MGDG synthase family glycosyltransferase n=1 Tax=Clostridium TaxID=1485 RepID=UPI003D34F74B
MKKVLILTTSTGQGHNQAANSLIEAFTEEGFECVRHDFLANNSKFLNDMIVGGYEISASKLPNTYGVFYKLTDSKVILKLLPLVFNNTIKKLNSLINSTKPDIIIGTHPFTVSILAKLKSQGMNVPFISVVTDFKAHYTYVSPLVDAYITASEYTKKSLVDRGINPDIIFPIGIPIKENFYESDKEISKIKDNGYFNLLLMSGSMGLKNISYVLDELLTNPNKLRITVVCGNNEKLKNSLSKKCQSTYPNKKLHILGFSNDIASLMEFSDVIISKPGGLTVTEAIAKNLPLIIPFVIPGQEMENTEFLTSSGYAYYVKDIQNINPTVNKLIQNPEYLKTMKTKLKLLSSSYSIKGIVNVANSFIDKYNKKAN